MLVLEQEVNARHVGRGVVLRARLYHGVQTKGWRMKFALLKADVEIEADPETYKEIAKKLKATNVRVRPARRSIATPISTTSVGTNKSPNSHPAILASPNQMKPVYCQDDVKVSSPTCPSPGTILPDLPQSADEQDKNQSLSKESTPADTQAWLNQHRFNHHATTFTSFSGADLLRLSRDDMIEICGLPDGIRLYNALHAKRIEPRLTVYICLPGSEFYSALYLHTCHAKELLTKLHELLQNPEFKEYETVLVSGPNGTHVRLTDELIRHMPDNSTYRLRTLEGCNALLLSSTCRDT